MQNNNQRTSAARHGRNVPHDEKQVTLSRGVAKHEKNESNYSSTTQATKPNPFKRTLDNEELYERQAAKKKTNTSPIQPKSRPKKKGPTLKRTFLYMVNSLNSVWTIQPNSRPKKKGPTMQILTTQKIHSL